PDGCDQREGAAAVSRHVLVVDDDDDIREVASLALHVVGGLEVTTASTGHEAVATAAERHPDVILLDVKMPDMDGPGTIKLLQRGPTTRDIPVILLTAKLQAQDRSRLDGLDVAGVIAKPFDPMTLAQQVADVLEWPR